MNHPTLRLAALPCTLLTLALALIFTPALTHAEPLTRSKIQGFIDSIAAIEAEVPELEELDDEMMEQGDPQMPDFDRLVSSSIEKMRGNDAYDRIEDLVEEYGFDSIEDWSRTGDRVYRAWMAIEMEQQNPAAQQQMDQALAELENDPRLSAEQKAQMRAMMEGAMGAMRSASTAPAEDIAAVRPHLDALRESMEDNMDRADEY